ncbi:zinc ABC transporter substrate-binding protein [Bacillus sp. FJAT-47783]|uniref:metal ABC transporter solute-binding protein, Zn/Mn family n=1 Tax=Bacillus sp. FJAT-47783 TaxID=2922712 RepID=UPI001FAE11FD|nr:zinc ABC transporter substrate-binding protein [Bacillus sp. FJAT-47783]
MKKWILSLVASFMVFVLAACGSNESTTENDGKIHVTTTIAQIEDIVINVGKDKVKTESLMGPGIDPHLYQASQGDIKKLQGADIIFYNGLHLEGKMGEVLEKMAEDRPTVPVTRDIKEEQLITDPANPGAHDPHVWFDINLWKIAVDTVAEELAQVSPEHKEEFKQNAEDYKQQLDDLYNESVEKIEQINENSRVLVTAHDAFAYFGRSFGFEVEGLQGLSTDSEYGLKDVQNIVGLLVDRDIKAVFIESSISEKSINAVVEGAKKKGHEVTIGGELFSDAMGEEGTEEGTYIGMFKHNIDTIVSSLK